MTSTLTHRQDLLSDLRQELERSAGTGLHVERTDIVFSNATPQWVDIEVTVRNLGRRRTRPAQATLQAAPLGAFVPWRPLTLLPVPSLEPGESAALRTRARRRAPEPLGKPERVSPRQLLTALDQDDRRPLRPGALPFDVMEMMGRTNPHWAGNLNVFVGRQEVERHMASALRIYPGRMNMAMFVVGSRPDAYSFRLSGSGAGWDVALHDATGMAQLSRVADQAPQIEEDDWIEMQGQSVMMLAICPPRDCKKGEVEVHVTQRSTMKEAVVEFSLDPAAAGPGCYVV